MRICRLRWPFEGEAQIKASSTHICTAKLTSMSNAQRDRQRDGGGSGGGSNTTTTTTTTTRTGSASCGSTDSKAGSLVEPNNASSSQCFHSIERRARGVSM